MSISELTHHFKALTTSSEKTILLKTADEDVFEIGESLAAMCQTIAHLIEDDCATIEVPLPNVTTEMLTKVLEYCKRHLDEAGLSQEEKVDLKKWDVEYMKKMENSTIFEVIMASNYLNVEGLLDLSCQTIADQISACGNAEAIRKRFEIENDYTPEEEEEVRRENTWAFE